MAECSFAAMMGALQAMWCCELGSFHTLRGACVPWAHHVAAPMLLGGKHATLLWQGWSEAHLVMFEAVEVISVFIAAGPGLQCFVVCCMRNPCPNPSLTLTTTLPQSSGINE